MSDLISAIQLRVTPRQKAFLIYRTIKHNQSISEVIRDLIENEMERLKKANDKTKA